MAGVWIFIVSLGIATLTGLISSSVVLGMILKLLMDDQFYNHMLSVTVFTLLIGSLYGPLHVIMLMIYANKEATLDIICDINTVFTCSFAMLGVMHFLFGVLGQYFFFVRPLHSANFLRGIKGRLCLTIMWILFAVSLVSLGIVTASKGVGNYQNHSQTSVTAYLH